MNGACWLYVPRSNAEGWRLVAYNAAILALWWLFTIVAGGCVTASAPITYCGELYTPGTTDPIARTVLTLQGASAALPGACGELAIEGQRVTGCDLSGSIVLDAGNADAGVGRSVNVTLAGPRGTYSYKGNASCQ